MVNNTINEKSRMRRRIAAVDFAIWEMTLYLDTHAEDTRAMKTLEQLRNRRAELIITTRKEGSVHVAIREETAIPNKNQKSKPQIRQDHH